MPSPSKLLSIYASDHDAGATACVQLLRRAASSRKSFDDGPVLQKLADEAASDLALLREQFRALGLGRDRLKTAGAWLGEKAGRLKTNGTLVKPSPLGYVVDLEGVVAVDTYTGLAWRTLVAQAHVDDRLDGAAATGALARHEARTETLLGLRGARASEAFRG